MKESPTQHHVLADGTPTRRHVLAGGASLLAASSIAGCVDGDANGGDTDSNGTQEPDPTALDIENLRFVREQPGGYRQFQEVEDATYGTEDVVWLYFEPVGVTTGDAGAGQHRIELTSSLTVTDPSGEQITSDEVALHRDVHEGGETEVYFSFSFTPTTPTVPGTYTADVTLSDDLADETVERSVTFTVEGEQRPDPRELGIERIEFVDGEPAGYREYTLVEDAVYGSDDLIWLYIEPTGVEVESREGDERWFELFVRVTTTDPDGNERSRVKKTVSQPIPELGSVDELYLVATFGLPRPTLGEYEVTVEIEDRVGRGRAAGTATFTFEDRDMRLIEIFREVVVDETGVDIERLALTEDGLSLVYQSPNRFDDDGFIDEIGAVAGGYAAIVEGGISATHLRANGQDAAGQEFAYEIKNDAARAWNDDEISTEEYVDQVLDSLRKRS